MDSAELGARQQPQSALCFLCSLASLKCTLLSADLENLFLLMILTARSTPVARCVARTARPNCPGWPICAPSAYAPLMSPVADSRIHCPRSSCVFAAEETQSDMAVRRRASARRPDGGKHKHAGNRRMEFERRMSPIPLSPSIPPHSHSPASPFCPV